MNQKDFKEFNEWLNKADAREIVTRLCAEASMEGSRRYACDFKRADELAQRCAMMRHELIRRIDSDRAKEEVFT